MSNTRQQRKTINAGDSNRNPEHHQQRFVAYDGEQIVGFGQASHDSGSFHPQKFWAEAFVLPERQGEGIGRKLYNHVVDHLQPFNPTVLEAATASNMPRAVRFLEDRGYELKTIEYSSMLDLNQFEPNDWASYVERSQQTGVEIIDHHQMVERFPDTWAQKLYDCNTAIHHDIPWHDVSTDPPFDLWLQRHNSHDDRINEAYLVAVDGDELVGVTMLFRSKATPDSIFTGMTGVKRSHRRKGIAIALKVQSLGWAKYNLKNSVGKAPNVMTENEENNPMYAINERMGFVRQPDFLMYRKEI